MMKRLIYTLNAGAFNLDPLFNGTDWERINIDTISQIDYQFTKENTCVLLVCGTDGQKLKEMFSTFELTTCNLPTAFLLGHENQEIINLCYNFDFSNIFINTVDHLLLKTHLKYTFSNYEMVVRNNGQKWLKHIDPNNFTKKEFQIIEYIAQAPLTELSREDLQSFIWGQGKKTTNKLDVHICNLRKKLTDQSVIIQTNERGKVSLGISRDSYLNKKVGA